MPRAPKHCAELGCTGTVGGVGAYCPSHQAQRDQARGGTSGRGYGWTHRKRRAAATADQCVTCSKPITKRRADLGHDDLDRTRYRGLECWDCNRGTSGRPPRAAIDQEGQP
jgi:hypothetical protein